MRRTSWTLLVLLLSMIISVTLTAQDDEDEEARLEELKLELFKPGWQDMAYPEQECSKFAGKEGAEIALTLWEKLNKPGQPRYEENKSYIERTRKSLGEPGSAEAKRPDLVCTAALMSITLEYAGHLGK